MRKRIRTWLALLLLAALCLCLSGCGSFQLQMAKTAQKMADLHSVHVDVVSEPKMLLNVGGQDIALDTVVTGGVDVNRSPLIMRTDLTMEVLGMEIPLRFYLQRTDEGWKGIPWGMDDEVEPFFFGEATVGEVPNRMKLMAGFVKLAEYFEGPEADTVNGEDASRYEGTIPADELNQGLEMLNLGLPTLTEDQTFVLWMNSSDMLVRMDTDLAPFAGDMLNVKVQKLLEEYGLAALNIGVDLREMQTQLVFSQFDAAPELSFPG